MAPTSDTLCILLGFELDSALRILENINQNLDSYGYSLPATDADLKKVGQQTNTPRSWLEKGRSFILAPSW